METKGFSVGNQLKHGWHTMKKHSFFFVIFILVGYLVAFSPLILQAIFPEIGQTLFLVLTGVSYVLALLVYIGLVKSALHVSRGEKPTFADLFQNVGMWIPMVVATVLYALLLLIGPYIYFVLGWAFSAWLEAYPWLLYGMILLFIPSVVFAAMFALYPYFIVDKGSGPVEALKKSKEHTHGSKWDVYMLMTAVQFVNFIGVLILGVGLLYTLPMTVIAQVYMYKKLARVE